jgi:hypothetical protein
MQLAYSALNQSSQSSYDNHQQIESQTELQLRYRAYQATCDKFSREIAAIQKYLPEWQPKFSY